MVTDFEGAEHSGGRGCRRGSGDSVHAGEQNDAWIVGRIKNDSEAVGCTAWCVGTAGGAGFGKSGAAGEGDVDRARCARVGGFAHA